MIDLSNINVILTGATGVIGGEILDLLNKSKANVIATGTNLEKLETINTKYEKVTTKKFDISDHNSIENFVNECNEIFQGKIDILVNNAGITMDNLSIRMKDDEWNKVININLTSSFLISKNVIKKMLKNKKGKIINITSVVGHTGNIGQANYAASKSGIIGMSKSLALEYGKKNITINCVSPGFIKSDMTDKIADNFKETMLDKISLERFGMPIDVANAVLFLSSNLSDYITGETIHVNGGMYFS
jgi:3-oxoacyl-[acyl-carrier protein] reductase